MTESHLPPASTAGRLLSRARQGLPSGAGAPDQADLGRSVSDAYYAMFHFLNEQVASHLMGAGADAFSRSARAVLVRGAGHVALREVMSKFAGGQWTGKDR